MTVVHSCRCMVENDTEVGIQNLGMRFIYAHGMAGKSGDDLLFRNPRTHPASSPQW